MLQEITMEKVGMLGWAGMCIWFLKSSTNNSNKLLSSSHKPPSTGNSSETILSYGLEYQN